MTPTLDGDAPRVQLLPAGRFRSEDGRPAEAECWRLEAAQAAQVIATAERRVNDFMFDYEHQTIHKEENGQPNPAAGWFKRLEFDPVAGLFATDVQWTARAQQLIDAKEYRYVSALFLYDQQGNVVKLINAALTNTPALDGMDELLAAASFLYLPEDTPMDENLRLALCAMLGLGKEADEAAIAVALTAAQETLLKPAACSTFSDLIAKKDQSIAALSQQATTAPDPSRFVPVSVFNETREQLAALSQKVHQTEADALIEAALSDGRIIPGADEDWMRSLATKDLDTFKTGLSIRTPNPALTGMQTGGKAPAELNTAALSADQQKMLGALGLDAGYLSESGGAA
ncbi:hypothetical protein NG99_04620 [Erwinia typographi]|uniref:Mu-like prophage I protein n=1 Tax=Erwinia typographi TaxID=371042 RepID=A0A0A3ZCG5_9GAMM|nr:hypothetical protein NG99_04620 [Erwinia typographi]